jgi:hypothetical protein
VRIGRRKLKLLSSISFYVFSKSICSMRILSNQEMLRTVWILDDQVIEKEWNGEISLGQMELNFVKKEDR